MRENCTILLLGPHETTLLTIFIRVHRPAFGRFFWRKYSELISYDRSVLVKSIFGFALCNREKIPAIRSKLLHINHQFRSHNTSQSVVNKWRENVLMQSWRRLLKTTMGRNSPLFLPFSLSSFHPLSFPFLVFFASLLTLPLPDDRTP